MHDDVFVLLLAALLCAPLRTPADLVAENPVRRHQLAAVTRLNCKRPRLRGNKLVWLLARLARSNWRQHLVQVRPSGRNAGRSK
jgi:hypothetical protein